MIFKNLVSKTLNLVNKNAFNKLASNFSSLSLKSSTCLLQSNSTNYPVFGGLKCNISTTIPKLDLMEFFETESNVKEDTIKHGRPWRMEELRIKSNTDLHKLWYVLHKERNMLLTMEKMYKDEAESFPSPERIAKVDESMDNILAVVEERNIAYNLLETGESKQIVSYRRYNSFGHIQKYKPREYLVPWFMNKYWKLKYHYKKIPFWSKHYRSLLRVKLRQERAKTVRMVNYATKQLSKKHPDMDKEFVQKHFEQKYGYKRPLTYEELIRRPKPSDVPLHISERSRFKNDDDLI